MSDLKKEFLAAQDAFDPNIGSTVAQWQAIVDRVYSEGWKLAGGPGVKDLAIDDGKAKPVADAPKAKPIADAPPTVEIRDEKKAGK